MAVLPALRNVPTLAEIEALRRGKPLAKGKTRLEEKEAKASNDDKSWRECLRIVDARDKHKCRACKRKTEKTLTLCKEREEHHHLVRRRKVKALMFDARNVVTLCAECHSKVTRNQLAPIGKAAHMFDLGTQKFLNADYPITWVKK